METKHTKGEWYIISGSTPLGDTGDYIPYMEIKNNENQTICYFSAIEDYDEPNAKLIAAAPELLEALNCLVNKFSSAKEVKELGIENELNNAINAIKKATI